MGKFKKKELGMLALANVFYRDRQDKPFTSKELRAFIKENPTATFINGLVRYGVTVNPNSTSSTLSHLRAEGYLSSESIKRPFKYALTSKGIAYLAGKVEAKKEPSKIRDLIVEAQKAKSKVFTNEQLALKIELLKAIDKLDAQLKANTTLINETKTDLHLYKVTVDKSLTKLNYSWFKRTWLKLRGKY